MTRAGRDWLPKKADPFERGELDGVGDTSI